MQRGALFAVLHEAIGLQGDVQLHADHAIVEVDCDGGRLRDARGAWHGPFDAVVVADGSASSLRAAVTGMRIDKPYPWGALWCLLPEGDWPWRTELRQRYLLARRMAGMLPVGAMPGDPVRRLSFFWSLPRDGFDAWEQAGLEPWLEEIEQMWPQARQRLQGITASAQLARASYRDAVLDRWYRGRDGSDYHYHQSRYHAFYAQKKVMLRIF